MLQSGGLYNRHTTIFIFYPCNASRNLSSSIKAVMYSVFDDSPSRWMPILLNEPSLANTPLWRGRFWKTKITPTRELFLSHAEEDFSPRIPSRLLLPSHLRRSLSYSLVRSSLSHRCRRGCEDISSRRGESHPLSLLSQARAREYVVAPFSSTLWCPPRSGYPRSSNLLPRAARGNARCIRMFLQLTRTLYVLITAERALKERHHLWPPCKWATPRQIACVSCQRRSLSSLQLPARKYLSSGLFYMYRIGEFERRKCRKKKKKIIAKGRS